MRRACARSGVRTGLVLALLLAGGCGDGGWFGGSDKKPLAGERLSIMAQSTGLSADPRIAALPVRLPPAVANDSWPVPGGDPAHAPEHLAAENFAVAWRASVGSGSNRNGRVVGQPIVAEGRIYAMDAGTQLAAIDAATGRRLWTFDVEPPRESAGGSGGGVAYGEGRVYAATGYAQVIAIDAATGKEIWRQSVTAPLRAGPTVAGTRLFVDSVDNQVHAFDAATGRKLWSHSGIAETAGLFGGSSPAVDGNVVVAAFSSGEIFALRADNGRVLWSDSLAGALRADPVSSLADIRGLPVIVRGQVIAATNAGRTVAIDLRSGGRLWEQNAGSQVTPWVAGDFVFVTTTDAELACLSRIDGRVRWVTRLPMFRDEKARRGRIFYTGPVLAGSRLFLANSQGRGLVVSPESGEIVSEVRLPGAAYITPIVAGGTVYVLTDDADLVALR